MQGGFGEDSRYQVSAKGVMAYVGLWAAIFAVVRVLMRYSSIGAEGAYPYFAGVLTDVLVPVLIGLLLAAVGVAVAFSAGQIKHARSVAIWCSLVGLLALPALIVVFATLGALGLIDLD